MGARPVPSAALGCGEYSLPFSVSGKARAAQKDDAVQQLTRVSRVKTGVPRDGAAPTPLVTGHHDLRRMTCIDLVM
jgi:hypothetical protein